MTTYTITTPQNITGLSAKAGGDTYNINGGVLTIDSDSRYALNTTAATGPLGTITISSALGGSVLVDGTKVRLIPYSSGSGNVPASGVTITQGGVTSELLGVWSAVNTTPTAAGSAMPASGFIKVRNVAGGAYAAGALTGIGATSRGVDIVGWIEVVGVEAKQLTIPRLGTLSIQGAWMYAFDTTGAEVQTSGVAGQQIQWPASVANTKYAGVFIETAPGSGVYARWASVSDLVNASVATDERARQVWFSSQGLMTIGSDGTNTVGLLPVAGCRIRVGNVVLGNTNATVGLGANSAAASGGGVARFGSTTNTFGVFYADKCNWAWGTGASNWYSFACTFTTIVAPFQIFFPLGPPTFQNNIVSSRDVADLGAQNAFSLSLFNGGVITDNTFTFFGVTSGFFPCTVGMTGGTFSRNRMAVPIINASVSTGALGAVFTNVTADSNEFIANTRGTLAMTNSVLSNSKFCAWVYGTAQTTPASFWGNSSGETLRDSMMDGLSWLIATPNTCQPRNGANGGLMTVGSNSSNARMRNIGTPTAPLDLGTVNPMGSGGAFLQCAFQVQFQSFSLQRCYFANGSAAAVMMAGNAANARFDIDCVAFGSGQTSAFSLFAPNSLFRAVTIATHPAPAAGAIGIHWADIFVSNTAGSFDIMMTDAAINTTDQMQITAGAPKFTGAPGLLMQTVGDQIVWTMRYRAQGHNFVATPTMLGGTISNYTVEFQADTGSGFSGTWLTANTTNLSALSINPAVGVGLKVRVTCTTANASTITGIRFATTTTLALQQAVQYPIDPVTISVTNIVAGSRIKVTRTDTSAVLDNAAVVGTTYSLTGDYTGVPVQVEVRCATPPGPYYQPWIGTGTVLSTGITIQALQVRDDQ